MGFAENLRALRDARGWSEMELSRRSGVAQGTINRLENQPDPDPKMRNLIKLARALDVSIDALIAGDHADAPDRLAALERRVDALERRQP